MNVLRMKKEKRRIVKYVTLRKIKPEILAFALNSNILMMNMWI